VRGAQLIARLAAAALPAQPLPVQQIGKASIGDLAHDDVVVPPGFTRALGGDGPVFDPALDGQAVTG
jgi:hypothetical protein